MITAKKHELPKKRDLVLLIAAFAAVYVIWGSTYLAIKYAIETMPTFLMAGTRFVVAGAILYAAEKATWLAGEAIQALGGNGYINEFPTGRIWRDAKLYEIGAGTSEIRRMLIGRELFNETK
jgi:alkylation response protein AidB-like acyl-CoA dehydrogenase